MNKIIALIVILSILSASFFATLKYIENRESEIKKGAYAQCEAEREKIKNNSLTESLQIVVNEQELQLAAIQKEKEKAMRHAKEQRERTNKLSQKIRKLNNEKDDHCTSISDKSLCLLNQAACVYNGSDDCEC